MSEIFPDRAEWLQVLADVARRRAPVPAAPVEPSIAAPRPAPAAPGSFEPHQPPQVVVQVPLKLAQARVEPQSEQPTTARPCSRCGDEPRAGSSGWGKRCIAEKMRNLRAARRTVNTVPPGQSAVDNLRAARLQVVNAGAQGTDESVRRSEIFVRARAARAERASTG